MSKVKVPAAFDKWYKQVEEKSEGYNVEFRAMYLIASQGFKFGVADEDNVLGMDFDLTEEEIDTMRYYVSFQKKDAMRAILDGYEVETQLYHIIFPGFDGEYLNYSKATKRIWLDDEEEQGHIKTKFTMDFIEEELPQYKQFAVEA